MLKRVSDPLAFARSANPEVNEVHSGGALDILKYLGIARRRGPLVVAFGVFAGLLASVYALQLVPLYTASATILLDPSQSSALAVNSGAGYSGYVDDGKIESELAIISSTSVAKRVAKNLGLVDEVQVGDTQPSLTSLVMDQIKSLLMGGAEVREPKVELADDPLETKALQIQGGIRVARQGFSYLIGISYTSDNPSRAAAIANSFADEYLVDQLESRFDATRRANDWLNERLGDLGIKVRDSERAVEVFKAENNIVDAEGSTLSEQQVAKLNEQLILVRAETAQARAYYEQLQAALKRGSDVSSFADSAQAIAIGSLRTKASEVRRQLAELTVKYGSRHPTVAALRAQLADVNRQIANESSRTVASAKNQLRVAESREKSISSSLDEMKGNLGVTNQAEITLRELEREATANRALHESFLSKFKETSQQETLKTTTARIIERAKVPTSPSAPNKKMIALLGLIGGLLFGGALAFLLEHLDNGFRSTSQAEKLLGVPVFASVPKADGEVDLGMFSGIASRLDFVSSILWKFGLRRARADGHSRRMRGALSRLVIVKSLSTFTEAIRALRIGVRFANVDAPRKVILISSAIPGEGKSTITSNFAQHAAVSGERVVLIDADLRHPVLTEIYAPKAKKGLIDIALGEATLEDVMLEDPTTGLMFIPAPRNRGMTHTAEILGSKRIKEALEQLSKEFDLVVVDSSPLLPVADGRALIDSVDALVLVIKWESTRRAAVEAALDSCFNLDGKLIGTVFNQIVPSRARYDGYYKSGYYMKKYPDYYGGKG